MDLLKRPRTCCLDGDPVLSFLQVTGFGYKSAECSRAPTWVIMNLATDGSLCFSTQVTGFGYEPGECWNTNMDLLDPMSQ